MSSTVCSVLVILVLCSIEFERAGSVRWAEVQWFAHSSSSRYQYDLLSSTIYYRSTSWGNCNVRSCFYPNIMETLYSMPRNNATVLGFAVMSDFPTGKGCIRSTNMLQHTLGHIQVAVTMCATARQPNGGPCEMRVLLLHTQHFLQQKILLHNSSDICSCVSVFLFLPLFAFLVC